MCEYGSAQLIKAGMLSGFPPEGADWVLGLRIGTEERGAILRTLALLEVLFIYIYSTSFPFLS